MRYGFNIIFQVDMGLSGMQFFDINMSLGERFIDNNNFFQKGLFGFLVFSYCVQGWVESF